MSLIEKVNAFFAKLPFKGMMEKIPTETRAKVPVLNKVIPFANQIVCGLVVVLLVTVIACSGKGGDEFEKMYEKAKSKPATASDFEYEWTADRKGVRVKRYTGYDLILVVPTTIEDLPVTEIGDPTYGVHVFGKDYVRGLILPDSITIIHKGAFQESDLSKITLPKGLKEIPEYAFVNCKKFPTIKLPDSIEKIGNMAFAYCDLLTNVTLSANLKEIDHMAFAYCKNLQNLNIPDSLSSVNFPIDSNSGINNWAFVGCEKLPLKTRSRLEDLGFKDEF